MADNITYSVKMNEETQEKLKSLVESSGLNQKDFFTTLLSVYEVQKAKQDTPILTADIEELETLTRRINSIFVNVSERLNTLQRETKEEQKKQVENNQSTISLLQQRINSFEQDRLEGEEQIKKFIDDKENAKKQVADLQNRINELERAAQNDQALINEYKDKLDTQTGIVKEYKGYSDENKQLQQQNADLQRRIGEQQHQINSLVNKSETQAVQHTEDLKRQQDTLNIEHEKALLELRTTHQRQSQEQQEQYNDKVKSLLERLENNKTALIEPQSTNQTTKPIEPQTAPSTKKKAPVKKKKDTKET